MNRTTYEGTEYVVARVRSKIAELVDVKTCKTRFVPQEALGEVVYNHKPIVPNFVPLEKRDVTFLEGLRSARRQQLTKRKAGPRKGSETQNEEETEEVSGSGTRPKAPRSSARTRSKKPPAHLIATLKMIPDLKIRVATAQALGVKPEDLL